MSHNLKYDNSQLRSVTITIIDYTNGGEIISSVEFEVVGAHLFNGAISSVVGPSQNSLAVPLFAFISGIGTALLNVKLFQLSAGVLSEIPTTAALNATIYAVIRTT